MVSQAGGISDTWVAPAALQVHTAEIYETETGHSFPPRQVPISVTLKLDQVQSLLRALDVPNVQRTGSQAAGLFLLTAVVTLIPTTTRTKVISGAQSDH